MTRPYGRCPRGQRLVATRPQGHWQTLTFVAALRHDRIVAPCVFDGPITGLRFLASVEHCLLPTLTPGAIVIMDNLSSHKGPAVRQPLREPGPRCASCSRIPRISTRLNRSSPSSKLYSATRPNAVLRQPGAGSGSSLTASRPTNVGGTSPMRAMPPPKNRRL